VNTTPEGVRAREPHRIGRQPSTTTAALSHVGLELFIARGFDATTVDDIASAAGIGRRTFFRYFASKNDVPWGDFDALLQGMREHLRTVPAEVPLWASLRDAVVEFNRFPATEAPIHRRRMELILGVPALVAHSTLRYDAWRQVIAEHAGRRLGQPHEALEPQAIGWTCLGIALAAYEQWLRRADADLGGLLRDAFTVVEGSFRG
jgi:TetR/AcrR family transcriptional regulator, regulator of mycofactocin system